VPRTKRHRHAIDSERDADGSWVETWVVAVTVRNPEELMVWCIRMVDNVDLPLTNLSSRFSFEGIGILRRVPPTVGDSIYWRHCATAATQPVAEHWTRPWNKKATTGVSPAPRKSGRRPAGSATSRPALWPSEE
jgi:hypothetical protein